MLALRLARSSALRVAAQRRTLATATVDASAASSSATATSSRPAPIPFSNIEAQWAHLSPEERTSVHDQLEVLQEKDWKELTLDEKKAAYYVAFGPHGPRTPTSAPGDNFKILLSVLGVVGVSTVLFYGLRAFAGEKPKTMTKEWQEASNERAKEMKLNPITGISSPDYKGKGFVQE